MLLNFSNGIVKKASGFPLLIKNKTNISMAILDDTPLIISSAHGPVNYLTVFTNTVENAWVGPFDKKKDVYLYIDINPNNADISFGYSFYAPLGVGKLPLHATVGQHFFEFKSKKMFVKDRGLNSWKEVIRVFVGELRKGSILKEYPTGSEFNLTERCYSGAILFKNNKAIKSETGKYFVTTELELQADDQYIGTIDQHLNSVKFMENVPKFYCVNIRNTSGYQQAIIARNGVPCNGFSAENKIRGTESTYIKYGYVFNKNKWNFSGESGKFLYVQDDGQIGTVPGKLITQVVGFIIDEYTIFIDVQPVISTGSIYSVTPNPTPTPSVTPTTS